jgi:HTH-type transcriptional regulator/antitoxin HigA
MSTTEMLKIATRHWPQVAAFAAPIESERQYAKTVEFLDAVLDAGGGDESHPLASLAAMLADRIEAWEDRTLPAAKPVTPAKLIRELMINHQLRQSDLPEIGPQSVVSFVLSGRRKLTAEQSVRLARRFGLPVEMLLERDGG